ncbi:hypothetical protein F5Y03DRAFT_294331 [Xylaria venustula]|nr:hypothetical protein F5Y03DRAFT_294331 [Xylaria venustula]
MPSCSNCNKQRAANQPMRECCTDIYYCNRKCERADFRRHKDHCHKLITQTPTAPTSQHAPQDASQSAPQEDPQPPLETLFKGIEDPFHRLKRGNYLQNRDDMNVYEILIDSYRLRMEDNEYFAKVRLADSIYGGARNGMEGFRDFLKRAKAVPHLLPYSWDKNKQAECEGLGREQGWSSLAKKIKDVDVNKHYQDRYIVMQLRLLAEFIYGTSIGHKPRCILRDRVMIISDNCSNMGADAFLRMALNDHLLKLICEDLPTAE